MRESSALTTRPSLLTNESFSRKKCETFWCFASKCLLWLIAFKRDIFSNIYCYWGIIKRKLYIKLCFLIPCCLCWITSYLNGILSMKQLAVATRIYNIHQNLAMVLHVKFSEVFLSIINNINYFTLCLLVSPLGRAVQRVKTYPLEMKSCRFKVYDYQVSKSGYHLLNSLSKTRLKSSIFWFPQDTVT